jgi:hypothetical protein
MGAADPVPVGRSSLDLLNIGRFPQRQEAISIWCLSGGLVGEREPSYMKMLLDVPASMGSVPLQAALKGSLDSADGLPPYW